jgi:hypothetical protein
MVTDPEAVLSHQEIVDRFSRVFGREMITTEPRGFFLPEPTERLIPTSRNRIKPARAFALLSLICLNALLSKCNQLFGVLLFQGLPCEGAPLLFGGVRICVMGHRPFRMDEGGWMQESSLQRVLLSVRQRTFPWYGLPDNMVQYSALSRQYRPADSIDN